MRSLVAFADIGDTLRIDPAPAFSFTVQGPFGRVFHAAECESGPESRNLAVRAVHAMAEAAGRTPLFHLTLVKALPLGAGLGGGSSDAGTVIWALARLWNIALQAPAVARVALSLGADVPVCVESLPALVQGIGEIIEPVRHMPELPVVLVWPGKPCPTARVFAQFSGPGGADEICDGGSEGFDSPQDLLACLERGRNDLAPAACAIVPEIAMALEGLAASRGCMLARLSGSGSACFGLFGEEPEALAAAEALTRAYPAWWVRAGWIGRVARY